MEECIREKKLGGKVKKKKQEERKEGKGRNDRKKKINPDKIKKRKKNN